MPKRANPIAMVVAVAAITGLTACGGSKNEVAAVRVGDNTISISTVDHWIRVESATAHGGDSLTKQLPKGVLPVPPAYTDCIAYLMNAPLGGPRPTRGQARVKCASEYKIYKETILAILIENYWDRAEGAARGVSVTDSEITHYLKQLYPRPGQFAGHLKVTGATLADERLLVGGKLLRAKLLARSAQDARTEAERVHAITRFVAEEAARWRSRTSCKPGYVVKGCKQFSEAES